MTRPPNRWTRLAVQSICSTSAEPASEQIGQPVAGERGPLLGHGLGSVQVARRQRDARAFVGAALQSAPLIRHLARQKCSFGITDFDQLRDTKQLNQAVS